MYTPIVVPRNKKYGNNYWNSDGPKVNMREVVLYSDLEFDNWVLTETDPTIKTYCEQPIEISFVFNGKLHSSIFDMWILRTTGKEEFIEVKYDIELRPEHRNFTRNMRQIQAQQEWCNIQGFSHKVMTEKEIRAFPVGLENRIKMLSDIKSRPYPVGTENILRVVNEVPKTIVQIYENLEGKYSIRDILSCCYSLSYYGKVFTNINEHIWSTRTEVWRNESNENY
ncbi:Tn7 transposase TnsA N-terminal domain-containing protein [Paenibacillus alginolyticus]|uniref:TnsA endonuclease N-terminal domain-containing protein n=1 Tax=Paenibacillus alginolyticus TaxID=59839 RepID=UPI0003FA807E|nr:TnsA endonuclease N-terminal domain-containing protein [Paenibacillus alginolyticus]MCY9670669.1 Tn7 transposase TnsA N-terminal domain-containing protein [Paenibacillus alginolyticus]